jgi:hypothetical protein
VATRGIVVMCIVLEGCGAAAFNCATDDVCDEGLCEPTGYCSFFDPTCPSGRRYGEHSGGLSGQCVPADEATGDASTSSPGSSSSLSLSSSSSGASESTAAISITGGETSSSGSSSSSSESSSTGETTLDPSLVAWYRFEGELAGIVEDATPNALHGTCDMTACPLSVEGAIGNAALYEGMQSVVVADDPLLRTEEAVTVAVWVRLDTFDHVLNLAIANKVVGAENFNTWELFLGPGNSNDSDQLQWEVVGDMSRAHQIVWQTTAAAGVWFHVVGVWEPRMLALYVDGELVGSEPSLATLSFDEGDVRIGADFDFGAEGNFMVGALDEVRIYDRALSEDEVSALYQLGAP